jgi:UDP-2,3-diacylglucosamine pyrophosphatase LpxH
LKKRRIDIAVLSNVHLGSETCHIHALLAYLSSISPRILILNGQFLEAGPRGEAAFPAQHFKVLRKIFGMAANGTTIYCIRGNQDTLVTQVRKRALGNFYFTDNLILDLDGKKAWFTHGEFLNSSLLRKKWTHGLSTGVFAALAYLISAKNKLWKALGNPMPILSPSPGTSFRDLQLQQAEMGKIAAKLAIGRGCEYAICGAPHHPYKQWIESKNGKCQYLSAGDWVQSLTTLEYNFKRWKPYRYSEDKLSPFFADEDLKEMHAEDLISRIRRTGKSLA